jgi:hypothetical protein
MVLTRPVHKASTQPIQLIQNKAAAKGFRIDSCGGLHVAVHVLASLSTVADSILDDSSLWQYHWYLPG